MSLGGFGLNPFADVSHLGNNIGSAFGNGPVPSNSQGVQRVAPNLPSNQIPIANPLSINPGAAGLSQPTANQNTGAGNLSGVSGGAAPDPAQAAVTQQTSFLQQALGQLPQQLQIAQGNIQGQYGQNLNELNSGQQQAQQQYNQGTTQNSQQYVGNKNQINDQASSGLHSLLRLLGSRGAGGSSDALYSAPGAVATDASQKRAGAGSTFGANQQSLDSNIANYNTGFNQSKQKLSDWLTQNLNSAQQQSDQTQQGILAQIAGIQPTTAAAQPFLDQSNALNNEVTNLGKLNPTYTGTTPTYTAPPISSYAVNPTAPVQTAQNAQESTTLSPFMSLLLGNQKDKQPAFNF